MAMAMAMVMVVVMEAAVDGSSTFSAGNKRSLYSSLWSKVVMVMI